MLSERPLTKLLFSQSSKPQLSMYLTLAKTCVMIVDADLITKFRIVFHVLICRFLNIYPIRVKTKKLDSLSPESKCDVHDIFLTPLYPYARIAELPILLCSRIIRHTETIAFL